MKQPLSGLQEKPMSKKVHVSVKMSEHESSVVREYCRNFDENMPELLTKLIFYAMQNAPLVKVVKALDLGVQGKVLMTEQKNLRGVKPGTKNRRK